MTNEFPLVSGVLTVCLTRESLEFGIAGIHVNIKKRAPTPCAGWIMAIRCCIETNRDAKLFLAGEQPLDRTILGCTERAKRRANLGRRLRIR